jgi:PPK2 family polyphosphate:nucleotide phosphotransferase
MDRRLRFARDLAEPLRVTPGRPVALRDSHPGHTGDLVSRDEAAALQREGLVLLADYQARLSAQGTTGVLLLLQGTDGAGKDGTIKHVMSGVNPQGVQVRSFKEPSAVELEHDFLWRHQRALPGRGTIGIFNRSHYEEVLAVRVHPDLLVAEGLPASARTDEPWTRRFREINGWERHLVDNGTRVVKVFLNISRGEQARRFLERIDNPDKNWKFSVADIRERRHWDEYQGAVEDMLNQTSTEWAPWYVIPADHKWFGRLATAAVLITALAEIDPQYPSASPEALREMAEARAGLMAEMGGSPPG